MGNKSNKLRVVSIRDIAPPQKDELRKLFKLYDHKLKDEVAINQGLYHYIRDGKESSRGYVGISPREIDRLMKYFWNSVTSKKKMNKKDFAKIVVRFMSGMQLWLLEESIKSLRVVVAVICKTAGIRPQVFKTIQNEMNTMNEDILRATETFICQDRVKEFYDQAWANLDLYNTGYVKERDFITKFLDLSRSSWDRKSYISIFHENVEPFLVRLRTMSFKCEREVPSNIDEFYGLEANAKREESKSLVDGVSIIDILDFGRSRFSQMERNSLHSKNAHGGESVSFPKPSVTPSDELNVLKTPSNKTRKNNLKNVVEMEKSDVTGGVDLEPPAHAVAQPKGDKMDMKEAVGKRDETFGAGNY